MIRVLKTDTYDNRGYNDEQALAALGLSSPDWLSKKMTYIGGMENPKKFSFLTMTEGNGNVDYKEGSISNSLNDIQYKWPVMGRMKHTIEIHSFDVATYPKPGIAHTTFKIVATDGFAIRDYGLLSPDKNYQLHIHGNGVPVGAGLYEYTVQLRSGASTDFVSLENLMPGRHWLMIAPKVSESGSRGNEHRSMSGGEMTNQMSVDRYTKKIEGNAANKVVVYEFSQGDTKSGAPQNLWMNEEQRQFEVWIRGMRNHDLYIQEYNRENGEIPLRYTDNGKPIPIGSGIRETVKEFGNYQTYGNTLPLSLIDNTINNMFYGDSDNGMEVVAHCGKGFARLFDNAVKTDATNKSYYFALGQQEVMSGKDGKLMYGKYFTQYRTIDGHLLTLKVDDMFDKGGYLGELDIKNGNMHPDGLPRSSYTAVVLDYTTRDSQRNIELVTMKGQSWITGVYEGMSPLPPAWRVGNRVGSAKQLATDKDEASYEVKTTSGINIKDASRCMILESVS